MGLPLPVAQLARGCGGLRRAVSVAAFAASCAPGLAQPVSGQLPAVQRLAERRLADAVLLARPTDLTVVGPYVVVLDGGADSVVLVLDGRGGRVVTRLGRRGSGPGEFVAPWSIDPVPRRTGEFWVYDLSLRRRTHASLSSQRAARVARTRTVQLDAGVTTMEPVWLSDSQFVALGLFQDGRLGVFDARGTLRRTIGAVPPGDPRIPVSVRQHAYQSWMRPNGDRSLLAIAARHASRLEILTLDGRRVAAGNGGDAFEPTYTVREGTDGPVMASDLDLRFGYVGLAASSDRVFGLYSGRSRAEAPGRASLGRYVHVFDWRARLLARLALQGEAVAIAVDGSGSTLYSLEYEPELTLKAYPLVERLHE